MSTHRVSPPKERKIPQCLGIDSEILPVWETSHSLTEGSFQLEGISHHLRREGIFLPLSSLSLKNTKAQHEP